MGKLMDEISAYERMIGHLETEHLGKWVLVHDGELISTYELFEEAAEDAVERFGQGPYLIRQVGSPPLALPASVLYRPVHARS